MQRPWLLFAATLAALSAAESESVDWHFTFTGSQAEALVWQTRAGVSYDLWYAGKLGEPFARVAGYPKEGTGAVMEHAFEPGMRGFFQIEVREWVPDEFVTFRAGTFVMGDVMNDVGGSEHPTRAVHVSKFAIQPTEVTNAQMADVINWALGKGLVTGDSFSVLSIQGSPRQLLDLDNSYGTELLWHGRRLVPVAGKEDHPCVAITWYGAAAYANYKTLRDGGGREPCYDVGGTWECDFSKDGYRLPTEAEWEKAARGRVEGARYPWGGDTISHAMANFEATSSSFGNLSVGVGYHPDWDDGRIPHTSPVGTFPATRAGLFDMAGNVREWCNDWYNHDYYGSEDAEDDTVDPRGPATGTKRVARGGSYETGAFLARCSKRSSWHPLNTSPECGFRVVRSP